MKDGLLCGADIKAAADEDARVAAVTAAAESARRTSEASCAGLRAGDHVRVISPFRSADAVDVLLAAGVCGVVAHVDAEGDAQVCLVYLGLYVVIFAEEFHLLEVGL